MVSFLKLWSFVCRHGHTWSDVVRCGGPMQKLVIPLSETSSSLENYLCNFAKCHLQFRLYCKVQQWLVTKLYSSWSTTILYLFTVQLHLVPLSSWLGGNPSDWLIDWVRLNVPPTQYRSYGGGFLWVKWPNQQCQSTEWTQNTNRTKHHNTS